MPYCEEHPQTETGLSCGKCGIPICPKCMVETPVGIRCKKCARLRRLPTYQVSASYYLKAAGTGLAMAVAGGFIWGYLQNFILGSFLFNFLIAAALGYAAGEVISLSVNRKRGIGLAVIGALSVSASCFIGILSSTVWSFGILGIAAAVVGSFVSIARLR